MHADVDAAAHDVFSLHLYGDLTQQARPAVTSGYRTNAISAGVVQAWTGTGTTGGTERFSA